jgi:hypothetical protein
MSLSNLAEVLEDLSRAEEALAVIEEAITIYRELAARRPDAYRDELEDSLQAAARLEHGEDLGSASLREPTQ